MSQDLLLLTIDELLEAYPHAADFLTRLGRPADTSLPVGRFFSFLSQERLEELGLSAKGITADFLLFMAQMENIQAEGEKVSSITILGGHDKNSAAEGLELTIQAGEIISIVGPTGSGKSRLLADIEWLAQGDTPSGRTILVNGQVPDPKWRFAVEYKLVAQLSQNMNFVMDMTVEEFIAMHAESRMVAEIGQITAKVIQEANRLAGEIFSSATPITALSGGQSRALMIADVAYLSNCPIVLIDEIENAGIDRQKALHLLVNKDKIVLLATHDPVLALMADKRLVIKNGGISAILETSAEERRVLPGLEKIDRQFAALRDLLRGGESLAAEAP
jgi:ABC-type lipoprotein export system ATPase subunit